MRYLKGSIDLNETKDYPLLRRVLHCTFVTPDQLFEFMRLDFCASSRKAFDNRVRRLQSHRLLLRHDVTGMSRGVVYSTAPAGASELISRGEYYSSPIDSCRLSNGHIPHALELNDIHLTLKRTRELVRWTPEWDIRSRNEFTAIGFVKDYDAIVTVRLDGQEYQFALEYERTAKSKRQYFAIRRRIEAESEFNNFLYLVSNDDLLSFLMREFHECPRPIYFGLRREFLTEALSVPVRCNRSPLSTSFCDQLTRTVLEPRRISRKSSQSFSFTH